MVRGRMECNQHIARCIACYIAVDRVFAHSTEQSVEVLLDVNIPPMQRP